MFHGPGQGDIPTDAAELRSRYQGGLDGGSRGGPRFKLGCGWLAVLVIAVAILLWLLGALLMGWFA